MLACQVQRSPITLLGRGVRVRRRLLEQKVAPESMKLGLEERLVRLLNQGQGYFDCGQRFCRLARLGVSFSEQTMKNCEAQLVVGRSPDAIAHFSDSAGFISVFRC